MFWRDLPSKKTSIKIGAKLMNLPMVALELPTIPPPNLAAMRLHGGRQSSESSDRRTTEV